MTKKQTAREALASKIKELKSRSKPYNFSNLSVGPDGKLADGKTMALRVTVADDEPNVIKGYLIAWGVKDTYGTIFVKGCCAKSIREHGPESNSNFKIKFLWQHDHKDPIGQFRVLREDDYGLYFEAVVDDVPSGVRALKQIKSGTLNNYSIGFFYIWDKVEWDDDNEALMLKEIELFEGSPVSIPANNETYTVRSVEHLEDMRADLLDDTEFFINQLPRSLRMEARTLFSRTASLAAVEPPQSSNNALSEGEPNTDKTGINYSELRNTFSNNQTLFS